MSPSLPDTVGSEHEPPQPRRNRVLINAIHGRSGGGITYLRNILPYLAADGRFAVDLILLQEQVERLKPLAVGVNLTVVNPPGGFFGRLIWEQIQIPRLAAQLGAKVTLSPANYGPLFAPRPVLVIQNALAVAAVESRFTKRLYWHALALMTAICVTTCSRAIVASEYMRRTLPRVVRRRGVDKISVIPMGVERYYSAGKGPDARPLILAVGDIYVQKNYHSLIRAFAIVARRDPDVQLTIAGRPIDSHYLHQLNLTVTALGLERRVTFAGELPRDRILALYRSATMFVMPSTVESFGLTLLEAMACGAAIASSRTAAMPEIAADAALYFDPRNPADIAEKILHLLDRPALRHELASRAAQRAQAFSWKTTAQRTIRVILSALDQATRSDHHEASTRRSMPVREPRHNVFTLLFIDDLHVENGYLDCLDALTDLARRFPDTKFRLILAGHMVNAIDDLDAGEDPPARLAKRLRYENLENDVELVGPADGALRVELFRSADVLIRPAWGSVPNPEQFFVEAASFSLPWIATPAVASALSPDLRDAGILIDARRPFAIADAIAKLHADTEHYLRLAHAARSTIDARLPDPAQKS